MFKERIIPRPRCAMELHEKELAEEGTK